MEISAPSHLPQHQRNKVLSFQDHLVNLVVFAVSQVTKTNKTIAEIEASVRRKVNTMSQEQISALLNPTETGYGVHLESFEAPDGKLYHQFGLGSWLAPRFLGAYTGMTPAHENSYGTKK